MRLTDPASDGAVLRELGRRFSLLRLNRNQTQTELAREAGVSRRTVERIEAGESAQLGSVIRILRALDLLPGLEALAPEPAPSPVAELALRGKQRRRASRKRGRAAPPAKWSWGDEP